MTSPDDWRLRVRVHEHGLARALTERLDAADLSSDLHQTFHDRVIVSIDGPQVFAYTGSQEMADSAAELVRELAAAQSWEIELAVERWHPSAQDWRDAAVPLPTTDAEQLAEHSARIAAEQAEARTQGYPEYEVRVTAADSDAAATLRQTLSADGIQAVQRNRYLLLGATDADAAAALADRVRELTGDAAQVGVEATLRDVLDELPPNPFAILGGLGG